MSDDITSKLHLSEKLFKLITSDHTVCFQTCILYSFLKEFGHLNSHTQQLSLLFLLLISPC